MARRRRVNTGTRGFTGKPIFTSHMQKFGMLKATIRNWTLRRFPTITRIVVRQQTIKTQFIAFDYLKTFIWLLGFEGFTLIQSVRLVADNTRARWGQGRRPLGSIANAVTIIITQMFHLYCVIMIVTALAILPRDIYYRKIGLVIAVWIA